LLALGAEGAYEGCHHSQSGDGNPCDGTKVCGEPGRDVLGFRQRRTVFGPLGSMVGVGADARLSDSASTLQWTRLERV
jgi:hypothetical protein